MTFKTVAVLAGDSERLTCATMASQCVLNFESALSVCMLTEATLAPADNER